jgi:hypothetical protein
MAIRRTLAQFSDEIVAADLADDSVTTAKIADSQITAAKVAADVATQAELDVVSTAVDAVDTSTEMLPYIRPGVLYPAVAGKILSGTNHTGTYGATAQTDGHKYYYTDIKGSKPIKDPRIGAHFGSQRHMFKSLQLLEQETATQGKNIYSLDGREWLRAYSTGGGWSVQNTSDGNFIQASTDCTGCYLEITGYFNDINFLIFYSTNRCDDIDVSVNGTLSVDGSTTLGGDNTIASPLTETSISSQRLVE